MCIRDRVDTLEAETMVSFAVAYDSCCEAFSQLPVSYQNCHAALRIGNIFYSSERIFGYRELGLGKLLYYVPREVCYHYLEAVSYTHLIAPIRLPPWNSQKSLAKTLRSRSPR